MAINFNYPVSKSIYSWIGNRILNPTYEPLNDPYITFGANPLINDFSGYKYLPTSLDISIPRYKEAFIKDVNGNPNYNDPVAELADKNWNRTVSAVTPNHSKIQLINSQWGNVIDTSDFNEMVYVAYVDGITPAGETYIGGGNNSNENVILINASFSDYSTQDLSIGTWGGWMLMHELGHVYGVFHGVDDETLNQRPDLLKMSIMWYPQKGNYAGAKIPLTPGMNDIKDLQAEFGASSDQDGDTSYKFTQSTVDLGHGNLLAGLANADIKKHVMTIWDGDGIDTFDASGFSNLQNLYIDLRDGHFSAIGTLGTNAAVAPSGADLNDDGDPDGDTNYNVGIAEFSEIENAKGGAGNDMLVGNDQDNALEGNAGTDKLEGADGNDTINGGTGIDTMLGGDGDDTYVVDNAGDIITEFEDEGIDLVKSSATYALSSHVENLTLTGTNAINGTGNTLNNAITGNGANNRLDGGAGNDTLDGGIGVDTLIGGLGNDTLLGGDGNDSMDGGDGNDILVGALGSDTMVGGNGNDIYAVNSTSDITTETSTGGTDTVYTTASITLQSNIENVVVDLTATLTVTGNTMDNRMVGNSSNNQLRGGKGNDTIEGKDGDDILWGDTSLISGTNATHVTGGGDDKLYGGVGSDSLNGESGADQLYGGVGNDGLDGGYGNDILYGEDDSDNLTGGKGDDQLFGGNGSDNYLFAQLSNPTLESLGKDVIEDVDYSGSVKIGANLVTTSTIKSDAVNTWVANTGELLVASADPNSGRVDLQILGGFTSHVNSSDRVRMLDVTIKDFANGDLGITLGGVANRNFKGTDNADVMAGSDGGDTLIGKKGNDTYTVNHTGDRVVEYVNEGTDKVESSIASYQLTNHVENLTLIGAEAIYGYGNEMANIIDGSDANNTLYGAGGNDKLYGGLGQDTLVGGLGQDLFIYKSSAESEPLSLFDVISDFTLTGQDADKIDLSAIDAISGGTDDAFVFIGSNNFSSAGQLRFDASANTLLADLNGDALVDFGITLTNLNQFNAANLIV